ncbi:MFS transporter [Bacteroides fragilis]|nr:MFS transporter [Bacteroides fragilis]
MNYSNGKWVQTYILIWSGQFISMLSSYAVQFAITIWLSLEHQSAEVLAFAGMAAILPQAIIGPFAGVLIDRWNRKTVLIVSDLFLALCAFVMSILLKYDSGNLNWIYLILVLRSVGNAFQTPAVQTIAPLIVPEKELIRVAGINQVLRSMCGIASPAIGTLAITYMSIHSVLYLDILGALAAILSLVFVFIPHYSTATTSLSAKHVVSDLKKGLDCVLANRGIALLFLCAMSVTFCIIPSSFYVPSTHDTMLSRWEMENQHNRNRVVCRDAVRWNGFSFFQAENEKDCLSQCNVCVIGNCLFSLWHLAVQLFCGLCIDCHIRRYLMSVFTASFITILQTEVPSNIQGRVFSLYHSSAVLPSMIGLLCTGTLAENIGISNSFLLSGSMVMFIGVVSFLSPILMNVGNMKK